MILVPYPTLPLTKALIWIQKLFSDRLIMPMEFSDPTMYLISQRQLVWSKNGMAKRGPLMIPAGEQHPERLRCYLIKYHICFKPVTKWWCLFSQSQNMKDQKIERKEAEMILLMIISKNTFIQSFSRCAHSLGLGRFWGPSSQGRNTSTREETQPWNWKVTLPTGHLGLLLSLNQQAEEVP